MSNTRFAYTNLVDAGTSSIANSPSADAAYPANNSRNGDRYIVWRTASSPGTPVDIEFDLGSAQAVTTAAILNMTSLISTVDVDSASTLGVWTNRGTIVPGGAVDKGIIFGSQSFRYWRFRITNSGQFSIGRLWLGVIQSDMGAQFSPGTGKSLVRNRRREIGPSGMQQSFYNGRSLHEWAYRFENLTSAQRTLLDNVMAQQKTALLVDEGDVFYEVELADRFDWTAVFVDLNNVDQLVAQELL